MFSSSKGSLVASLTALFIFSQLSLAQDLNDIASDHRWQALLHLANGKPVFVNDFILSKDNFSPLNELQETLTLFRSNSENDKSRACRFIARHFYLTQYANIDLPAIHCPEFIYFKNKVPIAEIDLLFASENFTQPSSIMGHTMLALSNSDKSIQHSVSFFTDIDNPNPVGMLWESLYEGKPGYFLVQPLQSSIQSYLEEQRNIWRYSLVIANKEKELIRRHLWELKFLSMPYLFNSHNCATLSFDILRVAYPELITKRQAWLSPIDVIKAANSINVINNKTVHASTKWKIRTLNQSLNLTPGDLESLDINNSPPLNMLLAKNYYYYQYQTGELTLTDWQLKNNSLLKSSPLSTYQLNISNPKDPLYTPSDSQFGITQYAINGESWTGFSWMPASHQLTDDNSQYLSENELKILQTSFRTNQDNIQLESLNIYTVKSFLPTSNLTNDLSGHFSMGFKRINYDNEMDSLSAYLSGGIGKTFRLHDDFKVYGVWQAGINQSKKHSSVSTGPQLGFIFNQVFKSKSIFYIQQSWRSNNGSYWEYNFDQSINYWSTFNLVLNVNQQNLPSYTIKKLSASINIYY